MTWVWTHCSSGRNSNLTTFNEFEGGDVHGWNHCLNFATLAELVARLDERGLRRRISRLAINCHGRSGGGIVELDRTLSLQSLSQFAFELRRLTEFMQRDARPGRPKLMFTGCATGADEDGTRMLSAISEIFVDVTVIGFEVPTQQVSGDMLPLAAADIWISGYIVNGSNRGRVDPFHPAAKWVHNNIVIRYPQREQGNRPNKSCAYPDCPGHADASDQCDGGWHPACEWRGTPATTPPAALMDYLRPGERPPTADLSSPEAPWRYRPGTSVVQAADRGFRVPGPLGTRRPRR